MSSFAALIATIQANIKTNGNEEITGAVLQDVLEAMVQALGTEAINNLETALGNEETARRNADGAINAKIPAEASSSNKLADKAFVTGLTTPLQNAVNAINANIENGYVYAGIATPSGTPVSGRVFYLARQAGTYTNFGGLTLTEGVNILKYNGTTWSQEQLISIADIFKNPLMGYYECDTAGGTAAKTVAATGYVLPSTGGSVKIKMANRNTVANATLNINSTGAKPLFYNGQRAGVGNTWDTNEIIEVFYDGTNYQAYNVAGSNGDGVFDISAYNLTDGQPTPYVDLSAALGTDGEHVPQSLRKGGMSVKFIQGSVPSSDNKYVQFRLMAQSFTTDETKWQGVDAFPVANSKNMVESGGVYDSLAKTYQCAVTSSVEANSIVKELYLPTLSKTVIDDVYRITVFKAYYDSGGNYYLNGVQLNTASNGSQNILKTYSTEVEALDDAKDGVFDVDSTHKAVVNYSKIESGRTIIHCTVDYNVVHSYGIQPVLYSYITGNDIKNIDKVTYVSDNQVINGIIKEFYNPGTTFSNTDLANIRYITISKARQSGSKYVNAINLLKDATHYFNYYYEYDTQQEAIDALSQGFVYWKNNYYIVIDWTNIPVGGIIQETASLCVERCTNIDFSPTIAKHLQHSIFDVDSVLLGQRLDNTNMAGFYTGTGGNHNYGNADAWNSWTIPVKEDAFYVLDFTPQFDIFFYDTYPIPRNKKTSLSKAVKKNEYFSIPSGAKAMVIDVPQDTTIVGRVQGAMKNGKKILWLGTSIPAGSKYPENASMGLGYDIINNSVGGSQLRFNKDAAIVAEPGAMLTATVSELETKYRQAVTDGIMTSDYLAWLKSKSFENLVLPYIADVDAVVIDHGYNDSGTFLDPQYYPDSIINDLDGQNYSITRDDKDYDKNNYIEAFCYLLKKIYEVNPKVRIIICSYYENTSGQEGDDGIVYPMYYAGGFGSRCGYHISLVHKAIVKHFNFAFMPMYDYLGWHYALVPDSEDYISDLNTQYGTSYSKIQFTTESSAGTSAASLISYLQMRCPDGVHPYSDQTGESIKQMSDVATKLLRDLV